MKISENLHFERYDAVETGVIRHILRQAKSYQNTNIEKNLIKLDKFDGTTDINEIKKLVSDTEQRTRDKHPKRLRDKSYKRDKDDNFVLDTHGRKQLVKNGTTRIVEAVCSFNIDNDKPLTPTEKAKFDSWKQFCLDELTKTLPKTWKRIFVAEHHSELSKEIGTLNSHIHVFYLPIDEDNTLNAHKHLKLENHFISLQQHNERKQRLAEWAAQHNIQMKLPEEMNQVIAKRIQQTKELTKTLKSKVLTAETTDDFKQISKLEKEKLKRIGLRIEDVNPTIISEQTIDRQGQSR